MDNRVFLFPISNSVLFKKVTLPYHIFEPRYRDMVKEAVAKQIPIAIVPYYSSNHYIGEICVAGIPHVLSSYPDGRMDIYITGSIKCRLAQLDKDGQYKIYRYRTMEENMWIDDTFVIEIEGLRTLLGRWAFHFLPDPVQRENFSRTLTDNELLVNYCAVFLLNDVGVKKEVMEAGSLAEKIKVILHVIGPKEVSLGPFMPALKF